jgi:hypothetical protein
MCIAVRQALVNTCCLVRTPANVSSAHVAAVLLGNQLMNNNSQQKSATIGGIGQQHPATLLGLGPTHEQQHLRISTTKTVLVFLFKQLLNNSNISSKRQHSSSICRLAQVN